MQGSCNGPRAVGCWDLHIPLAVGESWGAWGLSTLWLVLCSQGEMRAAEEKEDSSGPGPFLLCCLL